MRRAGPSALLAAVLGLSGFLFALPSLYVPAAALALLVAVTAVWVLASARGAAIDLEARPARVEEGEPIAVVASARLRRLSAPAELVLPGLEGGASTGTGGAAELRGELRFERRGRRSLGPARLLIRDPLGLSERTMEAARTEVLVLPRVEPPRPSRREGLDRSGAVRSRGAGPEVELDALRPLRTATTATRIHWPTVARRDEIVERLLVPESGPQPLVVLDPAQPPNEEALDLAVRAAASLCHSLAVAGGCGLILPGDRRATLIGPDLRNWPALHERLALVEGALRHRRLPRLAGASTLFWIAAAGHEPPRALLHAAARERFLVVPGPARGRADAFAVAGCSGRPIGPSLRAA